MIKRILKVLVVLLALTVNVRVKALSVEAPHGCRKTGVADSHCALYTEENIDVMKLASGEVHMAKGSSVVRESGTNIKIVRGLARVGAKSETRVKTLYGEIALSDGEVLVESVDSLVKFTNLSSATLRYTPLGEKESHTLPVGFGTYYAKVTTSGVAETGYPHPAEIEPLIRTWSKLYPRSEKGRLVDAIKDFMVSWKSATEMVGPWYLDTVNREIAAQEAEEARLARLKAIREAENSKLREMFRKRIFEE